MIEAPFDPEVIDAITRAIPKMDAHMREDHPIECVGLILGAGQTVPLINQARSQTRFAVSKAQLAAALADIPPETDKVYALYHSHPEGSTSLSPADIHNMSYAWTFEGFMLPWVLLTPDNPPSLWWLDQLYHHPCSVSLDQAVIHA